MIRVLILSDVRLYREGLAKILEHEEDIAVTAELSSPAEVVESVATGADVVLIDLAIPSGPLVARMLVSRYPHLKLVAIGVRVERDTILDFAEAGITGYVSRDGTALELADSIHSAVAGELRCSCEIAGALIERIAKLGGRSPRDEDAMVLTPRERQVVRLVDEGLTNKEIGTRLHIAAATARNHVHNILAKLGAQTRSGAAAAARRTILLG